MWNLLGWLTRPFPNSQEGNGLPVAVTKRPGANRTSCLHRILPGSERIDPAFTVVLLKFGNRWQCLKKSGDSFDYTWQKKMEVFPKSKVIKLPETTLKARAQSGGRQIIEGRFLV